MGMTMTQKIMAKHAGLKEVKAGQLITMDLDLVMANDITGPVSVLEYEKGGFQQVSDASRIALVMDHFAPNKDIKSAENCKVCRTFAKRFGIKHFYDTGKAGIEHALAGAGTRGVRGGNCRSRFSYLHLWRTWGIFDWCRVYGCDGGDGDR